VEPWVYEVDQRRYVASGLMVVVVASVDRGLGVATIGCGWARAAWGVGELTGMTEACAARLVRHGSGDDW
jgi:hypothetical protein